MACIGQTVVNHEFLTPSRDDRVETLCHMFSLSMSRLFALAASEGLAPTVAKNSHKVATPKASGYLTNSQLPVVAYKTVNFRVDRRLIRKFNAFTASALLVTLKPVCLPSFPRMFSKLSIQRHESQSTVGDVFFSSACIFIAMTLKKFSTTDAMLAETQMLRILSAVCRRVSYRS